jgi:hypothetical protein
MAFIMAWFDSKRIEPLPARLLLRVAASPVRRLPGSPAVKASD